ncbi:hypothetical protein PCK2_000186 [Pneumocystis canis]|nr:hypothetical protein PCK2_000186 [Pneumocystis canis]
MIQTTLTKKKVKPKLSNDVDKGSIREIEALLSAVPELEEQYHIYQVIDVWSAGIILLVFFIKRFPFFQSDNDINALVELAHIFGRTEMKKCARLHDCSFHDNIPSISDSRISWWQLIKIFSINDSYCIFDGEDESFVNFALDFLEKCLTLNPSQRIQSKTALEHPFLNLI